MNKKGNLLAIVAIFYALIMVSFLYWWTDSGGPDMITGNMIFNPNVDECLENKAIHVKLRNQYNYEIRLHKQNLKTITDRIKAFQYIADEDGLNSPEQERSNSRLLQNELEKQHEFLVLIDALNEKAQRETLAIYDLELYC